ncbi:protein of unknown function [Candidatus Nitrospira inopinata]|uniref:Uncharacterized protein n=1 Tax=Candidatus Nitrospira inopinata TaxID=1715989 RepID=A0A0S4KTW4_9BACT|nr:protein of unknown function [Candidatus Nitrospira inopinata]
MRNRAGQYVDEREEEDIIRDLRYTGPPGQCNRESKDSDPSGLKYWANVPIRPLRDFEYADSRRHQRHRANRPP